MYEVYDDERQRILAPVHVRRSGRRKGEGAIQTLEQAAKVAEEFRRGFIACHGAAAIVAISIRRVGGEPLTEEERKHVEEIRRAFRGTR